MVIDIGNPIWNPSCVCYFLNTATEIENSISNPMYPECTCEQSCDQLGHLWTIDRTLVGSWVRSTMEIRITAIYCILSAVWGINYVRVSSSYCNHRYCWEHESMRNKHFTRDFRGCSKFSFQRLNNHILFFRDQSMCIWHEDGAIGCCTNKSLAKRILFIGNVFFNKL